MIVNSVHYNFHNNIQHKPLKQATFEGKLPIDLNYVLENRAYLLPKRVLQRVQEIVVSKPEKLPTLKEVHREVYSDLAKFDTLQEAQERFPEFANMKEANISFKRMTGNIKKLKESGHLKEGFSLKMLKEFWVELKNQDEIAQELGLNNRSAITWILQKIGFVGYDTNYKTLLMASDPKTHATIASKTIAWNAAHPDLVIAKNKHAAQYMKKPENRAAHSKRMKKHFEDHPERRNQVSENSKKYWSDFQHREEQSVRGKDYAKAHPEKAQASSERSKAAWALIPEARQILKSFFKDYTSEDKILASRLRDVFSKRAKGLELTGYELMILSKYNKACATAHPEIGTMISKAYKMLAEDI